MMHFVTVKNTGGGYNCRCSRSFLFAFRLAVTRSFELVCTDTGHCVLLLVRSSVCVTVTPGSWGLQCPFKLPAVLGFRLRYPIPSDCASHLSNCMHYDLMGCMISSF